MEGAGVVAIGLAMVWAGYAAGIWGYCLVRGYDVSFANVFASQWPGVQVEAPTDGRKLGTIVGSTSTTNPGQMLAPG
jgi:hypothetical protein